MSMFLLLGFFLIMFIVIVMAFAAQQARQADQERADRVASALLDSTTIRTYVESCVSSSANSALSELAFHGGFYPNITRPGNTTNMNREIDFMDYTEGGENHTVAYLLKKSPYDEAPRYPCPLFGTDCGGPGIDSIRGEQDPGRHFCGFSLSNETQLAICNYGHRAPLSIYFTQNSIRNQLRYKVSENVAECIDGAFFTETMEMDSANVSEEDVETSVTFARDTVSFSVNVPIVVRISDAESVSASTHSHTIDVDFMRMFENLISGSGPGTAVYDDWKDLDTNIEEKANSIITLEGLNYEIDLLNYPWYLHHFHLKIYNLKIYLI